MEITLTQNELHTAVEVYLEQLGLKFDGPISVKISGRSDSGHHAKVIMGTSSIEPDAASLIPENSTTSNVFEIEDESIDKVDLATVEEEQLAIFD